jgi:Na+/H+ antiporter NhaD/arsenite permease-like protein
MPSSLFLLLLSPLAGAILFAAAGPEADFLRGIWRHPGRRLAFAGLLAGAGSLATLAAGLGTVGVLNALADFFVFWALLGALYGCSAGVEWGEGLRGRPWVNGLLLAAGALAANVFGTLGACLLLLHPLLKANQARRRRAHTFLFLIFIAGNCGGLLSPLGNPPLLMGYLRGVPLA